jgi:hypothetical protein
MAMLLPRVAWWPAVCEFGTEIGLGRFVHDRNDAAGAQCGAEGARPADGVRGGSGCGPHAGQRVAHAAGVRPPGARVCTQVRDVTSVCLLKMSLPAATSIA